MNVVPDCQNVRAGAVQASGRKDERIPDIDRRVRLLRRQRCRRARCVDARALLIELLSVSKD
jgi:hypothetical protein